MKILRNILGVLLGIFLGGGLNFLIIMYSGAIIPPPEGVDPTSMESIQANIHLFEIKHFIMPFLAHALGTLVGAFICTKIAVTRKMPLAMLIGAWFLLGGIYAAYSLGAPAWMNVVDVLFAYIPMAWIGFRLGR
jgi:hypothetical protein